MQAQDLETQMINFFLNNKIKMQQAIYRKRYNLEIYLFEEKNQHKSSPSLNDKIIKKRKTLRRSRSDMSSNLYKCISCVTVQF